ncbi:PepSY domain-containing protein [Glaciimonas sp. PAMC28666]|uniref:PepSY domain-containing protein n=1 Tax=Glaciimonas sp. PAMC28666 TaxID=2807626 RepID=UPI00351C21D6
MHSGRIFGLTGRILISIMGVIVAMLSATGLLIWFRKRRARVLQQSEVKRGPAFHSANPSVRATE